MDRLVLVKGGGELATGVAHRLHKEGFKVVIVEKEKPTAERRTTSFAEAVYTGEHEVEGVKAKLAKTIEDVYRILGEGKIPVVTSLETLAGLKPSVVVDARMAKRNLDTRIDEAPLVIGLGPGFKAGVDVHVVIETKPGPDLGKPILSGEALPSDGVPPSIAGRTFERLLVSPASGEFKAVKRIGERVEAGEVVGFVEGKPVRSKISGLIYGLVHDGVKVKAGKKIGDLIPAEIPLEEGLKMIHHISDRARAMGEAVLRAIQMLRG
ncbi:MAG: EF2563 family selenium-dependent molybdenum hydroxylase system protein [Candidatus Hecatellales archaeon]|nr:MAG: EF2563 family selenium-dependent molybdenum hydroxylase system protein [Candidatus Hecatellales archaeon]